jgi:hypothetical protein
MDDTTAPQKPCKMPPTTRGDAFDGWVTTQPTTMAGVLATLEYAAFPYGVSTSASDSVSRSAQERSPDRAHLVGVKLHPLRDT